MGINSTYNEKSLFDSFDADKRELINKSIQQIFNLGKSAVDVALSKGNYINRSGILRSSIGCGVSFEGVVKEVYGFRSILQGDRGAFQGKLLLDELLKENPTKGQIKLVVIAGAQHASFVENISRFTVLEDANNYIHSNMEIILSQLNFI